MAQRSGSIAHDLLKAGQMLLIGGDHVIEQVMRMMYYYSVLSNGSRDPDQQQTHAEQPVPTCGTVGAEE